MQDLNLAVVGNSFIAALIDRRGRIVWSCWPRLDGDPIFCSLLNDATGEDGTGFFDVSIENRRRDAGL
jgi:hypothetical protein